MNQIIAYSAIALLVLPHVSTTTGLHGMPTIMTRRELYLGMTTGSM